MSATADHTAIAPGRLSRLTRLVWDVLIGTLMCLTPVTAIIALGWLSRRMGAIIDTDPGERPAPIGWFSGSEGPRLVRGLSGLAQNIRAGMRAFVALAVVTLPYGGIWALAWWAGWTNSFAKGYENAAAGPLVFLAATSVFLFIWAHLPMALAHQAAKGRTLAFFEIRTIRDRVRKGGWSYLVLLLTTLLFALPLFASRGLTTFASGIIPGFDDMTPDQVEQVRVIWNVLTAGYIFTSVWILRSWAARIYRRGAARQRAGMAPFRALRMAVILAAGAVFTFVIVAGQFLNHSWWIWINHPLVALPWMG